MKNCSPPILKPFIFLEISLFRVLQHKTESHSDTETRALCSCYWPLSKLVYSPTFLQMGSQRPCRGGARRWICGKCVLQIGCSASTYCSRWSAAKYYNQTNNHTTVNILQCYFDRSLRMIIHPAPPVSGGPPNNHSNVFLICPILKTIQSKI